MKLKKYYMVIKRAVIIKLNYISMPLYMKYYKKYLNDIGIKFSETGKLGYVDPSCDFDGADYRLISIGDNTTISKEVLILVHDYSINRGLALKNITGKYQFLKPVSIGSNCFIGARTTLLPGTVIGDNCIIGSCSVVKGNIPPNSVVCGNPARIVCSIDEWTKKHIEIKDYVDAE